MALYKTSSTQQGFTAENAYHRVEFLTITNKTNLKFCVRVYKDPSFPAFTECFYSCDYILSDSNPIIQAYNHLKTLQEFSGSTDC